MAERGTSPDGAPERGEPSPTAAAPPPTPAPGAHAADGPFPGDLLGPYRVLETLGEGGMGRVVLAEQREPVRRKVALKVVRAGMGSREVLARFEAERQALALMSHPSIARVFDAGRTTDGRPYFVMEHIAGEPIGAWCDRRKATVEQRVRLAIAVCEGLQHAHQKGVIHRDIKPTNVLVEDGDGQPRPRIIDFGIAKAMHQSLTEATLHTSAGQFMGTPAYMSPEQAERTAEDIDTRSDIYSLGAMLYELLCGNPPFDSGTLAAGGYSQIVRILREQDPPRPSARIEQADPKDAAERALQRGTDRRGLIRSLRGDLDWIVMRCLEKDRARRYESAGALAEDLRRHLRNEPVLAGPPSAAYRASRFVRRHAVATVAAAALLLTILIGAGATTWQAVRATRAQREEAARAAEARAALAFLGNVVRQADPAQARGESLSLAQAMELAGGAVEDEFVGQPRVEAAVRGEIGGVLLALDALAEAEPHVRRSLELLEREEGPDDPETIRARVRLGQWQYAARDWEAAAATMRAAQADAARVLGPTHETTLQASADLGAALSYGGSLAEGEAIFRSTLRALRETRPETDLLVREVVTNLAACLKMQGKNDQALPLSEETLRTQVALSGEDHPTSMILLNNHARLLDALGREQEAWPLYERLIDLRTRVFGAEHRNTALARLNYAASLRTGGRPADAEPVLAELVAGSEGDEHARDVFAISATEWGLALLALDRPGEAEAALRRGWAGLLELFGEREEPHAQQVKCAGGLAEALERQGRADEAAEWRRIAGG